MSSGRTEERRLWQRVDERPTFVPGHLKGVRAKDLLIRFIAGGLTSIVAGGLTLAFGSRLGGIMLGFPAILAASLTLIHEEEDAAHAREDARGAVAGGCAMAAFAVAAALTLGHLGAAVALAIAAAVWGVTALALYLIFWFR
jgi:uncharacterized membrane protein (GlpM family)